MNEAQRHSLVVGQLEDTGKSRRVHPLRLLATLEGFRSGAKAQPGLNASGTKTAHSVAKHL